jgi:hypothetical protein
MKQEIQRQLRELKEQFLNDEILIDEYREKETALRNWNAEMEFEAGMLGEEY